MLLGDIDVLSSFPLMNYILSSIAPLIVPFLTSNIPNLAITISFDYYFNTYGAFTGFCFTNRFTY
jgi:hypothetical protein